MINQLSLQHDIIRLLQLTRQSYNSRIQHYNADDCGNNAARRAHIGFQDRRVRRTTPLTAATAPAINSVGVRHLFLARRGTLTARKAPGSASLQNRNSSVNFICTKQHQDNAITPQHISVPNSGEL